jgi:hypothetical protein
MVMQAILSELKMVPGVFGGYFFQRKSGTLHVDLPPMFKDSRLTDIGRHLGKLIAARRMNFPDARDVNLYFDESVLVARVIDEQLFLILLCERSVNTSMLSMSVRLAIEEQTEELRALAARAEPAGKTAIGAPLSPEQALNGPLKEPLEKIRQLMAGLMGPMAELAFEDAQEQWLATGQVGVDQLPAFIALLAEEMPDADKAAALKNGCRNLLG